MIKVSNLHKAFGSQTVLKGVDLSITEGVNVCIVGGSGSGKSVLLKLIFGLLPPDQGTVLIDGRNVWNFTTEDWHQFYDEVGVVFQSAALFDSLTVRENVGIRMMEAHRFSYEEIESRVSEALGLVGLEPEVLDKLPAQLSGGMKKRVGIARAIIHQPRYLVYDEPTTGLDPINSGNIDTLIEELGTDENRTSLIVTHDLQTVRKVADYVAMLYEGKIFFYGTSLDFFSSSSAPIQEFLAREKGD